MKKFLFGLLLVLATAVNVSAVDDVRLEMCQVKKMDILVGSNESEWVSVTVHYGLTLEASDKNYDRLKKAHKLLVDPSFVQQAILGFNPADWLGERMVYKACNQLKIGLDASGKKDKITWHGQVEIRGTWGPENKEWFFVIESGEYIWCGD